MPNQKIQFRLNPGHESERSALEVYIHYRNQNVSDRRLFTEALLHLGQVELPERSTIQQVSATLKRLERKIDDQHAQMQSLIIDALRGIDLSQFINPDGRTMADELGDKVPDGVYQAMMQNTHTQEFDVDD